MPCWWTVCPRTGPSASVAGRAWRSTRITRGAKSSEDGANQFPTKIAELRRRDRSALSARARPDGPSSLRTLHEEARPPTIAPDLEPGMVHDESDFAIGESDGT